MNNDGQDQTQLQVTPMGSTVEVPDIRRIALDHIKVSEICKRNGIDEGLEPLADSIRERGLIQFPTVMKDVGGSGEFMLIAGSRRYAACKALGWNDMPCHVVNVTAAEAALLSLSENALRLRRNPVEEAKAYQQMKEMLGVTDAQIAAAVGLRQSGVTERLSLLLLPDDILQSIDPRPESTFKLTHGVKLAPLMRSKRPNRVVEAEDLYKKVKREKLPSGEVGKLVELMIGGEFDQIPEKLRQLVMASKYMTSDMAQLYLHPEKVVEGKGEYARELRKIAKNMEVKEREQFIRHAVKSGLTVEQAKERLVQRLRAMKQPQDDEQANQFLEYKLQRYIGDDGQHVLVPPASHGILKAVDTLINELAKSEYHIEELSGFGADVLEHISEANRKLIKRLEIFNENLERARGEQIVTMLPADEGSIIGKDENNDPGC